MTQAPHDGKFHPLDHEPRDEKTHQAYHQEQGGEESAAERNVVPERAHGLGKVLIQQEQRGLAGPPRRGAVPCQNGG